MRCGMDIQPKVPNRDLSCEHHSGAAEVTVVQALLDLIQPGGLSLLSAIVVRCLRMQGHRAEVDRCVLRREGCGADDS